jgi:hypothetical protein
MRPRTVIIFGNPKGGTPDPALVEKIKDLRSMFMDAYTGWLEIEDKAA